MSTAVAAVRAHPVKYKLSPSSPSTLRTLAPSVKVASVGQNRPTKQQRTSTFHDTYKGKIESKNYSREECNSMSMAQCQQLYELLKKTRLIKSKKKSSEGSRVLDASHAQSKNR